MTSLALHMLLERLLWPVPRVRWEAGRSLAHLIRDEDNYTADGLLDWISARRLESEVILGLGVIDAFDLSDYFKFSDVSNVIRSPSHLSDFLLKKNFIDAVGLSPFRYTISPPNTATLPPSQEEWFDRYRKWAVPPAFTYKMIELQRGTYFPSLSRWEHDWRWLQATNPRPIAEFPYFYTEGDSSRVGQFDHGQRELYVSAYLRALAFASMNGSISHEVAENYSLLAHTMNRGLADLEPIQRPNWARNLLHCDRGNTKEKARKIWTHAEAATRSGEVPIALKAVDVDTKDFIELDFMLVIGARGFNSGPLEVNELNDLIATEHPGEMSGIVGQDTEFDPSYLEYPLVMTQELRQDYIGRFHIDIGCNIRLASPYVFGTHAKVQCRPTEIRLEVGENVFSRWVHWYVDWEPMMFRELQSPIGSMSTVSKSTLDRLCNSSNMEIAKLVQVRRGTRREVHYKHEVEVETFWA